MRIQGGSETEATKDISSGSETETKEPASSESDKKDDEDISISKQESNTAADKLTPDSEAGKTGDKNMLLLPVIMLVGGAFVTLVNRKRKNILN